MKIPPDSPTKEGQIVTRRGTSCEGLITSRTRSASWFWVKWDDQMSEQLCHQNELKVHEGNPGPDPR